MIRTLSSFVLFPVILLATCALAHDQRAPFPPSTFGIERDSILVAQNMPPLTNTEVIPQWWNKTLTDDPATNPRLADIIEPLTSKDAQAVRILKLSIIIETWCNGVIINNAARDGFLKKSRLRDITSDAFNDAVFLADNDLRRIDFRALAHLCAGSNYLFGPTGHLIPQLFKGGTGRPKDMLYFQKVFKIPVVEQH